jgi:hypothetical protein
MPQYTLGEIWGVIIGVAGVVFAGGNYFGQVIEKSRNGKYVKIGVCEAIHKAEDKRWDNLHDTLKEIQTDIKELMKR